jgi:hypothetical protein
VLEARSPRHRAFDRPSGMPGGSSSRCGDTSRRH